MKSAPHLLGEDRVAFGRILDEALRHADRRPELASLGDRLTADQLRGMAVDATALIAQAASSEYEHYREVREEYRTPAPLPEPATGRTSLLRDPARTGAGVLPVVAVLVPVLAGTAAVIFLLAGYLLEAVGSAHAFADTLIAFGWFFGAVMALGILAGGTALLITALRNSTDRVGGAAGREPQELTEARDAWRLALLERGILPFLSRALRDADAAASHSTPAVPATGGVGTAQAAAQGTQLQRAPDREHQLPKIGYSRPDFSSPGDGAGSGTRPTYSSPDFSSPDYGGPEHRPD